MKNVFTMLILVTANSAFAHTESQKIITVLSSAAFKKFEMQNPDLILTNIATLGVTSGCMQGYKASDYEIGFIKSEDDGGASACTLQMSYIEEVTGRCSWSEETSPLPKVADAVLTDTVGPNFECKALPETRHK